MVKVKPYLELFVGGMFAGKTSALLAKGKRHEIAGHRVLYVKPSMDDRYSASKIVTHDGTGRCSKVMSALEIQSEVYQVDADVVVIDEVQFFGVEIVDEIKELLNQGKAVYCSGLDLDYTGEPFEITMRLMGYANRVNKLTAVCTGCGDNAYVTAKVSGSNYRLEVGGVEKYRPLCRSCYLTITNKEEA